MLGKPLKELGTMSASFSIRPATLRDLDSLAQLRHALWPESTAEEHGRELSDLLSGKPLGTLPLAILAAEADDALIGFLEVGLRSHADGCNPAHAVGYVEGWYVADSYRRQGVGAALLGAAEDWARAQ